MKELLIKITDKKSENTVWKIIENEEVFIRDMRSHYSKTHWENMKDDLEWEIWATLTDKTKINKPLKRSKLSDWGYESGLRAE